jgi:hypothetical protein
LLTASVIPMLLTVSQLLHVALLIARGSQGERRWRVLAAGGCSDGRGESPQLLCSLPGARAGTSS